MEFTLQIPVDVEVLRFTKLDDIPLDIECITYYCQPSLGTFGALDSFILDIAGKKCYGLQMTLNKNHGIKHKPLLKFLTWLETRGINLDGFFYGFMVPKHLAVDFSEQSFLTNKNTVHISLENLQK